MRKPRPLTTWRHLLASDPDHPATMFEDVAPNWSVLDVEFDHDYGSPNGPHFLAWTADRVYFPVVYDGAEWVGSAPRNPTAEGQEHVGGT